MSHSGRYKFEGFTIVELLIVVVVIAILAAITLVAFNNVTGKAKDSARASTLAQWKKKSEVRKVETNISCPDNYAFVYGNAALGTSDFCVMKYEAKIQGNDNGQTAYSASMVADSRPTGTPWVNISQTNAITEAAEAGGHLVTEAEWMTIAADVLSVKYNWSGGEVGKGIIYQGHVNNNPGNSLAASADDTDNLSGMTGGIGTNSGNNSSRVLYLSSGDAIWDLSGNVYEWTQQAVGTPTLTMSQVGVSGDSAFNWREWTLGSLNLGNIAATSRPSALTSYTNPITGVTLSSATSWDATKGVGRIYANYADASSRAFARGGLWGNSSDAGVLMLASHNGPLAVGTSIGFRVAR